MRCDSLILLAHWTPKETSYLLPEVTAPERKYILQCIDCFAECYTAWDVLPLLILSAVSIALIVLSVFECLLLHKMTLSFFYFWPFCTILAYCSQVVLRVPPPTPRPHTVMPGLSWLQIFSIARVAIRFYMHRLNRIPAHKFQVRTYLMLPEI